MQEHKERFQVKLNYLTTHIEEYPKQYHGIINEEIKTILGQLEMIEKMESIETGEAVEI